MGRVPEFDALLQRPRGDKRKRRRWRPRLPSPIWIMAPLAALTVLYVQGGPPAGLAWPSVPAGNGPDLALPDFGGSGPATRDREAGYFGRCGSSSRVTCVVDGDTFWYEGTKIRISSINTPETHDAKCAYERDLGERATDRLVQVLNAGPFTLQAEPGNETDRYGRALRTVTRSGADLGQVLVAEGLAERWQGYRRDWC